MIMITHTKTTHTYMSREGISLIDKGNIKMKFIMNICSLCFFLTFSLVQFGFSYLRLYGVTILVLLSASLFIEYFSSNIAMRMKIMRIMRIMRIIPPLANVVEIRKPN
jgi:hypothetical protein